MAAILVEHAHGHVFLSWSSPGSRWVATDWLFSTSASNRQAGLQDTPAGRPGRRLHAAAGTQGRPEAPAPSAEPYRRAHGESTTGDLYRGAGGELVLVLDCGDLERAATFWGAALGYWWKAPQNPDDRYLSLLPESGDGFELLLQRVPEAKTVKNRMHLDLRVRELDAEVDRLCALGARRLTEEPVRESGWVWHVLADPDGNELCVLERPAEYRAGNV